MSNSEKRDNNTIKKSGGKNSIQYWKEKRLEWEERIKLFDRVAGYVSSKIFGLFSLTTGLLELIYPKAIGVVLESPELLTGLGIALLVGKGSEIDAKKLIEGNE